MTKTALMQKLWKQYEKENAYQPAGTRPVIDWALSKGLLELPQVDPRDILSSQMAAALRSETAIDKKGREYRINHAVKITKNGVQTTFWGILGFAGDEHMQMSFGQRRDQVVGDCFHLRIDVDAFNEGRPAEKQYALDLNFTEDVKERLVYRDGDAV